jgi:hypothetical protein
MAEWSTVTGTPSDVNLYGYTTNVTLGDPAFEVRDPKWSNYTVATIAASKLQDHLKEYFNGTASVLSVAVRWQWLALPVILVASSLIFSLINIARTHQAGIGGWKGGPLALLACGLDPHVRAEAMADMDVPDGLSKSIGNTKAVLSRDERGRWGLETE